MENPIKLEEASQIAALLPALMRRLFTLDDDLAMNLPLAQLRVCAILCDGRRQMTALSRELGVSLSAMTQIADRLDRAKLVSRIADQSDRRIRSLQLTPLGEKMMQSRQNSRIQSVSAVLDKLSAGARREILAALEMLLKASLEVNTEKESNGKRLPVSRGRRREFLISKVNL